MSVLGAHGYLPGDQLLYVGLGHFLDPSFHFQGFCLAAHIGVKMIIG